MVVSSNLDGGGYLSGIPVPVCTVSKNRETIFYLGTVYLHEKLKMHCK